MSHFNFDNWPALKAYTFQSFTFRGSQYEIWKDGRIVRSGEADSCIHFFTDNQRDNDSIEIINEKNPFSDMLCTRLTFDGAICLNDRILLYVSPKNTNVESNSLTMLSSVIGYTRESKYYNEKEPVCASIFTVNGNVVKVSFSFANPERLIEIYI